MSAVPEITVSVVSHGHAALLAGLLADLATLPQVARCVITVNIPEDPVVIPPALADRVVWRHNPAPLGYGANHNRAFTACDTPSFCVINPDVRLPANPFPALLAALSDPQAALSAPAILDPDGRIEDSVRHFPQLTSLAAKALKLADGRYEIVPGAPAFAADWVGGMFMLFRREAFAAVGGFDERFFLYYEDVDICARLGSLGLLTLACPAVSVIHAARRDSHSNVRYLRWHLSSMLRYLVRRYTGRYANPRRGR
jgi:N-acetylglucosaminyl-diphospho-decaprenol L-rhamnosyltransferase